MSMKTMSRLIVGLSLLCALLVGALLVGWIIDEARADTTTAIDRSTAP